jgi:hypothetical protein
MLDSVIHARDALMKINPNVAVVPEKSNIYISAYSDEELINDSANYWNNVYGFKMSPMKPGFYKTARVEYVTKESVVGEVVCVKPIDMQNDTIKSLDFSSEFTIAIKENKRIHGIVGWFDVEFDADVMFSTSPSGKATHWKQTAFMFDQGVDGIAGDVIEGRIVGRKGEENERELIVEITWGVLREGVSVGEMKSQKWLVA